MTRSFQLKKLAAIAGAVSAVALSSCTLPPDEAWRKIRSDGLIAYWSYELNSPYANSHRSTGPTTPTTPSAVPQSYPPRPTISPINQPGMMETGRTLTAQNIPSLPGFVRSPYTNPPRLVDVKGATPGSTMICPYTQRPFVIPSDYQDGSGTMVAENRPQVQIQNKPSTSTTPKKKSSSEQLPKVVVNNNRTKSEEPKTAPAPFIKPEAGPSPAPVASNTTPTTPSVAPSTLPAPKPVQEIPFGSAITGRPGFVNSPFAAKHQLVDVTGLPTGMEVKCPYTGKLFRVPPQDMASSKPADTAPLASPADEPKKK
jgi:hypothetical protein